MSHTFEDILAANAQYAEAFDRAGADGTAEAGLAVITTLLVRYFDEHKTMGVHR